MDSVILWASHLMACSPNYTKIKSFLANGSSFSDNGSSTNSDLLGHKEALSRCGSCKKLISVDGQGTGRDHTEKVMEDPDSLCDGECIDEAHALLDEEAASLEELAEASAVFDENGDGFIGAKELQIVMWKLLGQKMGMEDCSSMIRAYDENGDDMISFNEFRNMMEWGN